MTKRAEGRMHDTDKATSARPWFYRETDGTIRAADTSLIGRIGNGTPPEAQDIARAALIVRAVNNFDELVETLARIERGISDMRRRKALDESEDGAWLNVALHEARALLAKVRA